MVIVTVQYHNICISQDDVVRDEKTGDANEFKFSDDEIEGKSPRWHIQSFIQVAMQH